MGAGGSSLVVGLGCISVRENDFSVVNITRVVCRTVGLLRCTSLVEGGRLSTSNRGKSRNEDLGTFILLQKLSDNLRVFFWPPVYRWVKTSRTTLTLCYHTYFKGTPWTPHSPPFTEERGSGTTQSGVVVVSNGNR